MDRTEMLTVARRIYAKQIAHAAEADDPRIELALADVPRERFLPPGPWFLNRWLKGYQQTPDADPVYLYQDLPVAIDPGRHLNNGQPSFLIGLIAQGRPQPGETVVHVGTGTGYYTTVLAQLVGADGHVLGIEHDTDLAARAADELAGLPQARIVAGDGSSLSLPPADLILVNAGAAYPAATWLDALKPGGRLILPLTAEAAGPDAPITRGVVFLIERHAVGFAARCLSTTAIFPCIGARDPAATEALGRALQTGGQARVKALHRTDAADAAHCWLCGPGWSLTYV